MNRSPRFRFWVRGGGGVVVVLTALALVFAGDRDRAVGAVRAGSAPGPVLTVAMLQDVDSLNPFLDVSASAVQIFGLNYDRLTEYRSADNQPVPGLATRWSTSADRKTWTFTLRSGVRWSDGTPLTAADVAFTFTTIMKAPAAVNASQVKTFVSVSAPDASTVRITTRVPTATMLALDIPIVPEHVWAQRDPLGALPGVSALVGSGPFQLVEARPGQLFRLARNRGYWGGAPAMSEVRLRYFTNSDAAAQALRKGEVDLVGNLTPAQFAALDRDPAIDTSEAVGSRYTDLVFNVGAARADGEPIGDGHPALRDQRVRAAIETAIDRRALVARVLGGHGQVGAAYFPGTYRPWSWVPGAGVRRDFDPARANRMLEEAGYRRGADGVRVMPAGGAGAGRALRLRLFAPVERTHYGQSAQYLVQWLKEIGIQVESTVMPDNQISDRADAGEFDLRLGGWILDPDPDFQLSIQTCATRPDETGSGATNGFVCDRELDRRYQEQAHQTDVAQRVASVHRFQQRLYALAPLVVLYYPGVLEAYRSDRVGGLSKRPAGVGSLNGAWSYRTATPVAGAQPQAAGSSAPLVGALAAVLVVSTAVAVVGARRRRQRE